MSFLRKIAWPVSLLYGGVVNLRNFLYDNHILSSKSYDLPIICIGNLSVGGTGKTPMVEFLISRLQDTFRLAVLSRGYKRGSKGFQLACSESTVAQLGDEPFQMYKKFPQVAVAVDANRQEGIALLKQKVRPEVVLLDDAFQHRKVSPSYSILLTKYSQPYFADFYLPTGSLRDAKYASQRADCIVVTKCPENMGKEQMESFRNRLKPDVHQMVLFSKLIYDQVLYGGKDSLNLEVLKNTRFTLVTGIADCGPLVYYLKGKNLEFEHLEFPDHHAFSASDIKTIQKSSLIVTTEKDYVRLKSKVKHLYYIRIEHKFLEDGEALLLKALKDNIKPYR